MKPRSAKLFRRISRVRLAGIGVSAAGFIVLGLGISRLLLGALGNPVSFSTAAAQLFAGGGAAAVGFSLLVVSSGDLPDSSDEVESP